MLIEPRRPAPNHGSSWNASTTSWQRWLNAFWSAVVFWNPSATRTMLKRWLFGPLLRIVVRPRTPPSLVPICAPRSSVP